MKKPAYLFGPFVGELSWEFYRFAPYAIYMKKEHPQIPLIVFTRQSRFDLYGEYADVLVPLRIPNDVNLKRECYTLESLLTKDYNRIARAFASQYKKKYQIIQHFYPDIGTWRYRLKWQFPRRLMDYDFRPRDKNRRIAKTVIKHNNIIIDSCIEVGNERPKECVTAFDLYAKITNLINNYDTTSLGVLIECIKICRAVVGNVESELSHLALLLKKPLICINNKMSIDNINLLNPFETPIIYEESILRGIEEYENTI